MPRPEPTGEHPFPTGVGWPAEEAEREDLEGMLLDPVGEFVITDNYNLNRYGEIEPAAGATPLAQPTAVGAPVDFVAPVVLSHSFDEWRLQPTTHLTGENLEDAPVVAENTRTAAPEPVGGDVQPATFNVPNYTTTGDELAGCTYYKDRAGDPISVRGGCDARGAAEQEDLERRSHRPGPGAGDLHGAVEEDPGHRPDLPDR